MFMRSYKHETSLYPFSYGYHFLETFLLYGSSSSALLNINGITRNKFNKEVLIPN